MKTIATALTFALGLTACLAACGDDSDDGQDTDDVVPDSMPSDGGVDGEAARPTVFAVAGDFAPGAPGASATIELRSLTVTRNVAPNGAVSSDPAVRRFDNKYYVVNRFGANNVTVLSSSFTVEGQYATGAGSNPQDVAVVGTKLYVATLTGKGLTVVGPGITAHEIDLSSLDPDGNPDCVSAYKVGTLVYVACGTLDDEFKPRGNGKVAIVDTATDTLRSTLMLTTANPFSLFEQLPDGNLVIGTVPDFGDPSTGGVELVTTGATPAASGRMIMNTDLGGGYATTLAVSKTGPATLYLVVSTSPAGALRSYDLTAHTLRATAISPATQTIGDVATCSDGEIAVSDTTMAANGVRIYNADLSERTTAPLAIGLRPTATHGLACE